LGSEGGAQLVKADVKDATGGALLASLCAEVVEALDGADEDDGEEEEGEEEKGEGEGEGEAAEHFAAAAAAAGGKEGALGVAFAGFLCFLRAARAGPNLCAQHNQALVQAYVWAHLNVYVCVCACVCILGRSLCHNMRLINKCVGKKGL